MMAAKLLIPRNIRRGMQIIRNIKLILLSFHDRFLNFSETSVFLIPAVRKQTDKYKKVDRMAVV